MLSQLHFNRIVLISVVNACGLIWNFYLKKNETSCVIAIFFYSSDIIFNLY